MIAVIAPKEFGFSKYYEQLLNLSFPDRMCIVFIVSSIESVCLRVGAEVCRWMRKRGGIQREREDGSSPKLAEGPALVFVVRFGVGLPAFPLRRFVVNVGRRTRVVIWILLHHLELGLDGADLSARASGEGGGKKEEMLAERQCWCRG